MTNPTEAPMANAIDDVKEWVLVPTLPSFAQIASLARKWGYTIEEAADTYDVIIAEVASPAPSQHTGWSDEADTDRMQKISEVIAHLQSIQDRFGDTCVYIRRGGLSWGAVALNRRDDDKKNGVFDLQAQHDLDMSARLQQVQRLIDDNRELRTQAALAASSIAPATGFQDRVAAAHVALFHDDPTDLAERRDRFGEEANEVQQALGQTREDAHRLVDYTYDRPAGEPEKEIGAAALTLASLCVVGGWDMMACAEADLAKLVLPETIARIRAKRSTRHGRGPLPGLSPSVAKESGEP